MLLRRSFSIYRARSAGVSGGTVEVVFAEQGRAPGGWDGCAPETPST
jgi:hypothetical protein